jgi:transposase
VDGNGLPVQLGLTGGQAHDNRLCSVLLRQLPRRARLLADRGYDADWIRAFVAERGAWANIPPKRNRKDPICFSPYLYRDRNLVERFFNKIKQFGASRPDTTSSPPTTSLSSSSPASAYGCAFMSARCCQASGDKRRHGRVLPWCRIAPRTLCACQPPGCKCAWSWSCIYLDPTLPNPPTMMPSPQARRRCPVTSP